jgi:hypothetical protein
MNILKMAKNICGMGSAVGQKNDISEQDMIDRFLFVQALDTLRCYEEGVLESVIDANVGSIFGIGFARGQVERFNS